MRGKNKIWMTMAAILIASLAISMMSIPKAYADNIVSVVNPLNGTSEFGPFDPGDMFSADIAIDYIEGLRSFEFTLSWNPNTLRLSSGAPAVEGPFLPSGGPTFFVKSIGVAGESITVADLIMQGGSWVDGSGVLATVNFEVIGGGQCNLDLTAKLLDANFGEMPVETVGGHFFSSVPYLDFQFFVPTPIPTGEYMSVTGVGHYIAPDGSGNPKAYNTEPYYTMRPIIHLDGNGYPTNYELVSGTMLFGDDIIFDASGSYDLDNSGDPAPLDPTAFHWVIRAGGVDTIRGNDVRYESGVELPYGPTFTYNFPGALPYAYTSYGSFHLGWFDLTLTVTDSDDNTATYTTWIRIYRIAPGRTMSTNIPNKHVHRGETLTIGGRLQNRVGAGYAYPWTVLQANMELGRIINGYFWGAMKFVIKDSAGHKIATLYTDAVYMTGTEYPVDFLTAAYTVPTSLAPGMYSVTAWGVWSGTGAGYGLQGAPNADWFEVLP